MGEQDRWHEITPSAFTHEAEGLAHVRKSFPTTSPFTAWSNFEFRDDQGRWHEIDLLVLGKSRLHLVELKFYSGTLRGDDHRWLRDGRRAEDSPLRLARSKAQRLRSRLQREAAKLKGAPEHLVPYIQEAVFLHHPDLRVELEQKKDLFGLDGNEQRSGLAGISQRIYEPASVQDSIPSKRDVHLIALMARIGVVQRKERPVGSWVIEGEPIGQGDGWQDWKASHRTLKTERARIRFRVSPPGTEATRTQQVRKVVEHEFRVMSRLRHDGVLAPKDLVDDELGTGLVYPADERLRRLDLWVAEQQQGVPLATALAIVRQVGEALHYAHGSKVVHRGLTPHAVQVRTTVEGVKTIVGDWQSAGTVAGTDLTGMTGAGVTSLQGSPGERRVNDLLHPPDADHREAEAYEAPEGVWSDKADRVRLDVFALGALTYYLVAGRPAAVDRRALKDRLQRDRGLDLAADLPQVSSALRNLVLEATRPTVSERLPDVGQLLKDLAEAERALSTEGQAAQDPLEAMPGQLLDGRFKLVRRLGAGSTAVGLLVEDLHDSSQRVLKVALDDTAADRITAEAEVLRGLKDPRLVRLLEGPIEVGTRRALLLESAGEQTLADLLRDRRRVSLDLLERYGTDLLEALVALDRFGVDHRDVKPANLGVREGRGDRVKHLVLFDFSLARAGATAVSAGTPPYLDPFLGSLGRERFDSAAERWSAAVVLFELATGSTPVFGDGLSDPSMVEDQATLSAEMFDPTLAEDLQAFFACALQRTADQRHDTAADMLSAWRTLFVPVATTVPDDETRARVEAATASTSLGDAGLSARALSALESFGVQTVGDLLAVEPARLSRMRGAADVTRREIRELARTWRARVVRRAQDPEPVPAVVAEPQPDAQPTAEAAVALLLEVAGAGKDGDLPRLAAMLLGTQDGLADPFAGRRELGVVLDLPSFLADKKLEVLQKAWRKNPGTLALLDALGHHASAMLAELGGVALITELRESLSDELSPSPAGQRIVGGLLRVALDHAVGPLQRRRRDGTVLLVSADRVMLDAVEHLSREADRLVADATPADPVVGGRRATDRLRSVLVGVTSREDPQDRKDLDNHRLLRLAVSLAEDARLSGADELHHRDLSQVAALALSLAGVGGAQPVGAREVRDRVRARFPALAELPDRPRLDELVEQAGLGLVFDQNAYRSRTRVHDTTGLGERAPTLVVAPAQTLVVGGHLGHRLSESKATRSFLALGVTADRVDRAHRVLEQHGARTLDLTATLLGILREHAAQAGVPWDALLAADAAAPGTKGAEGLKVLVARAVPLLHDAIAVTATQAAAKDRPLLLVEAAPLARYGHLASLSRWTDLTSSRSTAVWLLVPQLMGSQGPTVDGRPLPLAAPGQYVRLETAWVDTQHAGMAQPA